MIRLSSTIGPVDAGIIPLLISTYEKQTGVNIECSKAGTAVCLENAKTGNFEMVIVHARALEDQFINEGYGLDRRDIMYNDFIILGPKEDPAGIKGMTDAVVAFKKIAAAKALFVTRGDMSGTHVKELEVWDKSGKRPDSGRDAWYYTFEEGDRGNAHTALYANNRNAYTLMDRATCILQRDKLKIIPLLEKDEILLNFFASIQVNPQKFPGINAEGAKAFIDWLCAEQAQTMIRDFEKARFNEPLFFPNSDEWKSKQR